MSTASEKLAIVEKLRPLLADEEAYGRLYADLHDLIEASEWFLAELGRIKDEPLSVEQIENFLIDLDVHYIQHTALHLASLRGDIKVMLAKLAEREHD